MTMPTKDQTTTGGDRAGRHSTGRRALAPGEGVHPGWRYQHEVFNPAVPSDEKPPYRVHGIGRHPQLGEITADGASKADVDQQLDVAARRRQREAWLT